VLLAILILAAPAAMIVYAQAGEERPFTTADYNFFESKIRPLLVDRCYKCHSGGAKVLQGGLRLDNRAAILRGGDSGPPLSLNEPQQSLILEVIGYEGEIQMPPSGTLPEREIALLTEWVLRGAPLPDDNAADAPQARTIDFAAGKEFWSFRPLQRADPPMVGNAGWVKRPIDAFILAEMAALPVGQVADLPIEAGETPAPQRLSPSPPVDRRTLLRRATFDLTGLPPTPAELDAFLIDSAPDAYERLVERLLASPHYGERWGRYWLDLVRYCDLPERYVVSDGQAWLYRDWVVRAFNDDMPYDDFVRRQLATDMLPETGPEDVPALGLLGLSPIQWKELKLAPDVIETVVAEEWEERINAVTSTFLGLTVACARCHDHKFDPISTEDYYALAGVFASIKQSDLPIIDEAEARPVIEAHRRVATLRDEIKTLQADDQNKEAAQSRISDLKSGIAKIEKATPNYDMPLAFGIEEASLHVMADGAARTKLEYRPGQPQNVAVQIRGNPANLGPLVPRRFLSVLSPGPTQPFRNGSGRLELAEAIIRDAATLTARVIVNCIWAHHFGRGLVDTPSNFGAQGSRPSHPALLDDLAARFIEQGWSTKWLHREIMLSATYQQASSHDSVKQAIDPDNRLLWRMNRRRLDIESWRDAMLSVSGLLDRSVGGPAAELSDLGHCRRTLYGSVKRSDLDDMLRLNDFPDPTAHSPGRDITTTPLQQLFALNSPFIERQSAALLSRLEREASEEITDRIELAYRLLFSRSPTPQQLQLAADFLTANCPNQSPTAEAWRHYLQALLVSNEFMFID